MSDNLWGLTVLLEWNSSGETNRMTMDLFFHLLCTLLGLFYEFTVSVTAVYVANALLAEQ